MGSLCSFFHARKKKRKNRVKKPTMVAIWVRVLFYESTMFEVWNAEGMCIGCFSQFLGPKYVLYAELVAAMTAIEIAHLKGYYNVWLESDSQLVILVFKSINVIPWSLRNRWYNWIVRLRDMRFVVSHIYREGNACADSLANLRISLSSLELF